MGGGTNCLAIGRGIIMGGRGLLADDNPYNGGYMDTIDFIRWQVQVKYKFFW